MQRVDGYEKSADGEAVTLIRCSIKLEHPFDADMVNLTMYAPDAMLNVCTASGFPGNKMVTGGVPSPKSQTHWIIESGYPETTDD
jgi:hypothetical protein